MRWIFRLLGIAVTLAVLGLVALLMVPTERIAGLAAAQLGQSLGREVTVTGAVRPSFWPHLAVRAEGVRVANPDWVDEGPMLSATAMFVRLPWAAILGGTPRIDEITLIAPELTLVRAADGRTSWTLAAHAAPSASTQSAPASSVAIAMAEITDGRLRYIDEQAGQRVEITDIDVRLTLPTAGTLGVSGRATTQGVPLSLSLDLADIDALLAGRLSSGAVDLGWPGGTAQFFGQLGLTPVLTGDLSVAATDLAPLASVLGVAMPELPLGFGRDSVALVGQVALTDAGSVHLWEGRLSLDQTALSLALDLTQGEARPMIRGRVTGEMLRLPGGNDSGPSTQGWSRAPIDVDGLFAADAEIGMQFGAMAFGDIALGPVDLTATLTRGRMVFDIARIGAYGGAVSGQFVINGRGGLSVGGDLRASNLALLPMLRDVAGFERLEGSGNGNLQFLGVGNDLDSIMSSLSGAATLSLGAGVVRGIDLAAMIRNRDTSLQGAGARTVYDSARASFTIADGVLANDDLTLAAGWGGATGAGTVDLGGQSLDYRLIPAIAQGGDNGAIRVPVLIRGPWSGPSIRLDLEYLAQQELAVERARLEAEAQARIDAEVDRLEAEARARANEALGTQLQQGDTVQDAREALEQRLRDEAEQQLLRLLGRGN